MIKIVSTSKTSEYYGIGIWWGLREIHVQFWKWGVTLERKA